MNNAFIMYRNMNCFQTAFVPYFINHNLNPNLLFLIGWHFKFKKENRLYECLKDSHMINVTSFLCERLDIHIDAFSQREAMKIKLSILMRQYKSIVIEVDGYYCNWSRLYQNIHAQHYFYINGDVSGDKIACFDYYSDPNRIFYIKREELEVLAKQYSCLRLDSNLKPVGLDSVLGFLLEGYVSIDIRNEFLLFSETVLQMQSFEDIFENSDVNYCSVIIRVHEYYGNRIGIGTLLTTEGSNSSVIEIGNSFLQMGKLWEFIKTMFIKMHTSQKYDKIKLEKISRKLLELGNLEWEVYARIGNYLKGTATNVDNTDRLKIISD